MEWHSLMGHSFDVAAMFEGLLALPQIARRLGHAAGRDLQAIDVARLTVLAFLHDLGKATRGFWGRQFPANDRRRRVDARQRLFSANLA
jgi:CRISPR-associated endonuclease/helicase Cas3